MIKLLKIIKVVPSSYCIKNKIIIHQTFHSNVVEKWAKINDNTSTCVKTVAQPIYLSPCRTVETCFDTFTKSHHFKIDKLRKKIPTSWTNAFNNTSSWSINSTIWFKVIFLWNRSESCLHWTALLSYHATKITTLHLCYYRHGISNPTRFANSFVTHFCLLFSSSHYRI